MRPPASARLDFLLASGSQIRPLARQYGISVNSLFNHWHNHVSDRYKKLIGASRLETFEALMQKCIEGEAETLDVLIYSSAGTRSNGGLRWRPARRRRW